MTPDWMVIAVFDPDGGGRDFGYTVGLHERGLPELFLWARPTDGDDPGADWQLSSHDICHQLNDLAAQLVAGTITPGSSTEVSYDGGATQATLTLQPAVAAHGGGLEAFQAHAHANVSEIRWSLRRPPVGPRRALDTHETVVARARLAALIGAAEADVVTFPPDATFGPQTPVFTALRSLARSMDSNRADHLIAAVHLGYRPESDLASIQAAARQVDLHDAVTTATSLAHDDAHRICERAFADDPELERMTISMFMSILAAAYGAEITHHAVPEQSRGTNEVLWALLDPERRHTRRFVRAASRADAALAVVLRRPDTDALAATVDDVDDETLGSLVGLWPIAAVDGHGSGLWVVTHLVRSLAGFDTAWRAGAALATAGYDALGVEPPAELGDGFADLTQRVAAAVRATALPKAS